MLNLRLNLKKKTSSLNLTCVKTLKSVERDRYFYWASIAIASHRDEVRAAKLNKRRDVLLGEVKNIKETNLKNLNQDYDTNNSLDDLSVLFSDFCFILEFAKHLNLIMAGGYLTLKSQLELCRSLFDSEISMHYNQFKIANKECLSQIFEVNSTDDTVKILNI